MVRHTEQVEEPVNEYAEDLYIDETALDVELLNRADLTFKYGKILARAKKIVDERKEELEIVRAELSKDIRANSKQYGLEKTTENIVADTIILQDKYKEAAKYVITAQYDYNMAKAAFDAVISKKEAIDGLIKLHGMQYFAGPITPRDLTVQRELKKESANTAVGKFMKRKR